MGTGLLRACTAVYRWSLAHSSNDFFRSDQKTCWKFAVTLKDSCPGRAFSATRSLNHWQRLRSCHSGNRFPWPECSRCLCTWKKLQTPWPRQLALKVAKWVSWLDTRKGILSVSLGTTAKAGSFYAPSCIECDQSVHRDLQRDRQVCCWSFVVPLENRWSGCNKVIVQFLESRGNKDFSATRSSGSWPICDMSTHSTRMTKEL